MDFEKELKFYIDNQRELVEKYDGKVIIIKNQTVVGIFGTTSEAYNFGVEKYGLGNFAIQQVGKDKETHTAVFHSPGIVSI
jgi:hypothetical protein